MWERDYLVRISFALTSTTGIEEPGRDEVERKLLSPPMVSPVRCGPCFSGLCFGGDSRCSGRLLNWRPCVRRGSGAAPTPLNLSKALTHRIEQEPATAAT